MHHIRLAVPPVESIEALINARQKNNDDSSSSDDDDAEEWARDDPYAVCDDHYRRVSNEEYKHSLVEPFDRDTVHIGVDEFVRVMRRLHEKPPPNVPIHEYHQIDPVLLVRAVAIACNIERMARLTASTVPYDELQMLENYDTTKVLNYIKENPQARQKVWDMTSELLFSLMVVDATSRQPLLPSAVQKKFAATGKTLK